METNSYRLLSASKLGTLPYSYKERLIVLRAPVQLTKGTIHYL